MSSNTHQRAGVCILRYSEGAGSDQKKVYAELQIKKQSLRISLLNDSLLAFIKSANQRLDWSVLTEA